MTGARLRLALCIAVVPACLGVAGCGAIRGASPSPEGAGSARTPTGQRVEPRAAMNLIAAGQSTRDDVLSALGKAIVVPFDSGHEVWIYRWAGADRTVRGATELVVLFAPSGRATKVRLRPGYPAPR